MSTFIMLNLFILIILQNFEELYIAPNNPITNFKNNLENFSKVWTNRTKHTRGVKIHSKMIVPFFRELEPPLGIGHKVPRHKAAKAVMHMNLRGLLLHDQFSLTP